MPPWLSFQAPWLLAFAAGVALAVIFAGWRAALPRGVRFWCLASLALLALAAGAPETRRPITPRIALMVDLSPSTRGAPWRDPAWLASAAARLGAHGEIALWSFAADQQPTALDDYAGAEQPALETRLSPPPDADVVVVLTDGRLRLEAWSQPAVLAVAEDLLQAPRDAAVTRLERDGDAVVATARSGLPGDEAPTLVVEPTTAGAVSRVVERSALVRVMPAPSHPVVARVGADDPWPEDDLLRLPPVATDTARRLWVGEGVHESFEATPTLPTQAAQLAGASVVVLANVSAASLPPASMEALRQYVMEMGGTVLIVGGDRAFAAGDYAGSLLEALSPLASVPPEPRARWVLLADASGSMAGVAEGSGGATRFALAVEALREALAVLPEAAEVDVGSFAASLRWWMRGTTAGEARSSSLRPAGASPGGPTNLAAALRELAAGMGRPEMPVQVIVLTDARVPLEDVPGLAAAMREARIVLNVVSVSTGDRAGAPALAELVEATGGRFVHAGTPADWPEAARRAAGASLGEPMARGSATVRFAGALSAVPPLGLEAWNRTWPKREASRLVESDVAEASEGPEGAIWQVGLGRVAALGFAVPPARVAEVAVILEGAAGASGYAIEWRDGPELVITVTSLAEEAGEPDVLVQRGVARFMAERTGPRTWTVRVPAPREPGVAAVVVDGDVVERRATAGRYAPEFELEPMSLATLEQHLPADGHEVIPLSALADWSPPRRYRRLPLAGALALLAALCGGVALATWRARPER